jgi:RHS repeat-associated protein
LTAADGTVYGYDLNGNRNTAGYQTGTGNQITNDGTWTYTYDAVGDIVTKSKGTGLEKWYYGFDTLNRLTSIRQTSDGTTNQLTVTYTYDVYGHRAQEDDWQTGVGSSTTRTAFAGGQAWADLTAGNVVTTRYIWGAGSQDLYARIDVGVGLRQISQDRLGSVRDVWNGTGVLDNVNYSAYGAIAAETGSTSGGRFLYTALPQNRLTVTVDATWRTLFVSIGRWDQPDPITIRAGDGNFERYVGNDPTNLTDPTGLYQTDVHFYMTYYLALAVGLGDFKSKYGQSEAYVIAWADQFTDVHTRTEPLQLRKVALRGTLAATGLTMMFPPGFMGTVPLGYAHANRYAAAKVRWRFHFAAPSRYDKVVAGSPESRLLVDKGIASDDLMLTGVGLHLYQDSWSHEGYGAELGHAPEHRPDYAWVKPEKAMAMAEATYDKLAEYLKHSHGREPTKSWKDVKAVIEKLFDEHDAKDDENIKYRTDKWHEQTKKDLPDFDGEFVSNGDSDSWAKDYIDAIMKVYPDLDWAW